MDFVRQYHRGTNNPIIHTLYFYYIKNQINSHIENLVYGFITNVDVHKTPT